MQDSSLMAISRSQMCFNSQMNPLRSCLPSPSLHESLTQASEMYVRTLSSRYWSRQFAYCIFLFYSAKLVFLAPDSGSSGILFDDSISSTKRASIFLSISCSEAFAYTYYLVGLGCSPYSCGSAATTSPNYFTIALFCSQNLLSSIDILRNPNRLQSCSLTFCSSKIKRQLLMGRREKYLSNAVGNYSFSAILSYFSSIMQTPFCRNIFLNSSTLRAFDQYMLSQGFTAWGLLPAGGWLCVGVIPYGSSCESTIALIGFNSRYSEMFEQSSKYCLKVVFPGGNDLLSTTEVAIFASQAVRYFWLTVTTSPFRPDAKLYQLYLSALPRLFASESASAHQPTDYMDSSPYRRISNRLSQQANRYLLWGQSCAPPQSRRFVVSLALWPAFE